MERYHRGNNFILCYNDQKVKTAEIDIIHITLSI